MGEQTLTARNLNEAEIQGEDMRDSMARYSTVGFYEDKHLLPFSEACRT